MTTQDTKVRAYEALLIFPPTLKEDGLQAALDKAGAEIGKLGGKVTKSEVLGDRSFSRHLGKHSHGTYARVAFDMAVSNIDQLKGRFKLDENVFRFQVTRYEPIAPKPEAPAE